MKLLPSSLILLLLLTITRCSSEKEGDLLPDCSQTSLSLEIVETINAKCETPGEVELLGSGGQGGYSYGLDGNTFQSSPTFDGLSAGGYIFYVKDIAGCVVSVPGTIGADDGSVVRREYVPFGKKAKTAMYFSKEFEEQSNVWPLT